MRKTFALAVAGLLGLTLCGCSVNKINKVDYDPNAPSMFVQVEMGLNHYVVYHKDTKVMYVVSGGASNAGTFTMLVNPDGSPYLYEE